MKREKYQWLGQKIYLQAILIQIYSGYNFVQATQLKHRQQFERIYRRPIWTSMSVIITGHMVF